MLVHDGDKMCEGGPPSSSMVPPGPSFEVQAQELLSHC